MLFESVRWPAEVHVARALIEGPLDREPSAHVFFESRVPWLHVNDALPKKLSQSRQAQPTVLDRQPDGAPSGGRDA